MINRFIAFWKNRWDSIRVQVFLWKRSSKHRELLWRIMQWVQALKQKRFEGWILLFSSVIVISGISIAVNRYFLYTSETLNSINCLEQLNLLKILFLVNSPEDIACIKQSGFWQRLSELDEPLNIRNLSIGFVSLVGLILAVWRSWVGERQTRATEERRIEERINEKRNEERRFDERFANAAQYLSQELNATSYPAHLGAITALRDLAVDNIKYTQRCLDILCSCNQWMEGYLEKFAAKDHDNCYADIRLTKDTQITNPVEASANAATIYHEIRTQGALKSISLVIRLLGQADVEKNLMSGLDFSGKMLCGINLSGAKMDGINFRNVYLNGADLHDAQMQAANLERAQMRQTNLLRANLQKSYLPYADLQKADMSYIKLQGANLNKADMQEVKLFEADLKFANLQGANLREANLNTTRLKRAEMQDVNLQGAVLLNTWMAGANLGHAQLQGSRLSSARLQGARLHRVQLQGARIYRAQLQGANLEYSQMQGVLLDRANLNGAILLGCNLYGAEIKDNDFAGVIFDEISSNNHIEDKLKRKEWAKSISDEFHNPLAAEALLKKVQSAWNKNDKKEVPQGLDALQDASILEKDPLGNWEIKPSYINALVELYHNMIYESYSEFDDERLDAAYAIYHRYDSAGSIDKDYPKIQKLLENMWYDLAQTFREEDPTL
ncbi:MAG: pentapeptide repeat-containing protein [Gammaproteobacteria bacterium]|nr:pentapeptide repeat-containing protein [Gammaproteobacteria bacterium]